MTYILGYFSVPAFSILIGLMIGVFTATAIACYFDLKSREAGLNKLPEGAEWARIPKKRLQAFRTSVRESSSKEEELPLLTPKEPSTRSTKTPSKVAASRLDQEEKHKRMIEAVYIASGRAVPAHLVSSTRTAVPRSLAAAKAPPGATVLPPQQPQPASDSVPVDKAQSMSGEDSVRTMATIASEITDDNTQGSTDRSDRLVHQPAPEQISIVRDTEKTAPTLPPSEQK
ncbi:hypothetical protein PRIPAC_83901 [Pristionchus pacificus]|uniref:Uncharacterized protein n=1 Tax=Pristionchus pacificus TaxID=54126 RepID=A0A2A6BL52_PRIPA|nr:hypothetical protein PRIPAC_83901 [Pristionchus pacificus]|eukprot:PDM66536.1 hypothetical protein PRIPAC_47953 [Pristionchus pacificus]